jgi:hypothetical protein
MTHDKTLPANDMLQAQRDMIRQSLTEITTGLNSVLAQAGLAYPVYICVPTTGHALATFACPLDPDARDWHRIGLIACEILEKKIGATRLTTRSLACAMAGTTMGAAEIG